MSVMQTECCETFIIGVGMQSLQNVVRKKVHLNPDVQGCLAFEEQILRAKREKQKFNQTPKKAKGRNVIGFLSKSELEAKKKLDFECKIRNKMRGKKRKTKNFCFENLKLNYPSQF